MQDRSEIHAGRVLERAQIKPGQDRQQVIEDVGLDRLIIGPYLVF